MANVVFNMPDVLTIIAEKLPPAMVIHSLLGVNVLSTKIALQIRKQNNLDPLINRYMLMLDSKSLIPVRKSRGLPVSQLDTDTLVAVTYTYKPTWSADATERSCVGAASVYFNQPGSRSGIGGLTIYDDVISRYPIRIPAYRLAAATTRIVGKRQRRIQLSLPADTTTLNIVAKAREALASLDVADNYAGIQAYSESMELTTAGRYQLLYLSPQHARDFLKSRDSTITLQCTAHDVQWAGDKLYVRDNRGQVPNCKYCKNNLIGLKWLI